MVQNRLVPVDVIDMQIPGKAFQVPTVPVVMLSRNFIGTAVNVGTSPIKLYAGFNPQNIIILNPSKGPGGAPTVTGMVTTQSGVNASGNCQATPLGVSNYLQLHLFLNVSAITGGSWSFYSQAQDPVSLNWADTGVIQSGVTTPGTFYNFPGSPGGPDGFGVSTSYAMRWSLDSGGGAITFTVGYALKYATVGSAAGPSQIVYIGANNQVNIGSGFPILEGTFQVFQVQENTDIWGVGSAPLVVNLFEM